MKYSDLNIGDMFIPYGEDFGGVYRKIEEQKIYEDGYYMVVNSYETRRNRYEYIPEDMCVNKKGKNYE